MKAFLFALIFGGPVLAQIVVLPAEWKKLDRVALLEALDTGNYPFLARRLTMSTVDPKFAAFPGPQQEAILWEVEKALATKKGRKPISFLIWDTDLSQYCDQVALDGSTFQVIVFPPLLLAVHFSHDGDVGIAHVYARLADDSKIRINVLPQTFRIAQIQPKLSVQSPMDPMQIARKIESRAKWSAGFSRMAGAMQTTRITTQSSAVSSGSQNGRFSVRDQWTGRELEGTYSGSASGTAHATTTTTVPDYEARARAEEHARAVEMRAAQRAGNVESTALKANTLAPGAETHGVVYFKRDKKANFSILAIPIGTFQFEFGFQWQ